LSESVPKITENDENFVRRERLHVSGCKLAGLKLYFGVEDINVKRFA
jgi:hypothetical protein